MVTDFSEYAGQAVAIVLAGTVPRKLADWDAESTAM